MKYLILAFVFYYQNLFFSLVSSYTFETELFEFLSILIMVLFIARFVIRKLLFILWQTLYFLQFSFYLYFGDLIHLSDIKLFFTHIDETFESFIPMAGLFTLSIGMSVFIVLFIISNHFKKIKINLFILFVPFMFFVFNSNHNDASIKLIKECFKIFAHKHIEPSSKIDTKLHTIKNETNQSIILIIGESIRAKEHLDHNYSFFDTHYTTIYSAATNTDVSVPMFLNGATNPTKINLQNNLFDLAKQNKYTNYFISTQNTNYLKYINPYLGDAIDNKKVLGSQNDSHLLEQLSKIDFSKKSFVVLQMQGAHSPYRFHDKKVTNSITDNYYKCIDKSNTILEKIKDTYQNHLIIYTSDHGENLGENNTYGHNRFSKYVYKVPLVVLGENNISINTIDSHKALYDYIYFKLGYSKQYIKQNTPITIYGTMISAEDRYIVID